MRAKKLFIVGMREREKNFFNNIKIPQGSEHKGNKIHECLHIYVYQRAPAQMIATNFIITFPISLFHIRIHSLFSHFPTLIQLRITIIFILFVYFYIFPGSVIRPYGIKGLWFV